jgi:hypothetical protein
MELAAVQCMPTGKRHWDITTGKNISHQFEKSIIKLMKELKRTVY